MPIQSVPVRDGLSIESVIIILLGPPFNRTREEIGWFSRQEIQKAFLMYRDENGIIDTKQLIKNQQKPKPESREEQYRNGRRLQGVPEYIIDSEIRSMLPSRTMKGPKHGTQSRSQTGKG